MNRLHLRTTLLLLAAFLLHTSASKAQNFTWVKSGGLQGNAVTTDAAHNTIVAGSYYGNTSIGSATLTGYGTYDAFVAKYDPSGTVLWAKGFGGAVFDGAGAVATDASGAVYVCGYFLSPVMRFTATDSLAIGGAVALYLAKFDASGNFQWARKASVPQNLSTSAAALAVDASGNIIMGGTFGGSTSFGTISLTGGGSGSSLYLVKYTSTGNVVWAKAGVTTSYCQLNGVAVDGAGNIYATGKLGAPVNWGTGPQPVTGTEQVYVAKFNSTGVLQWMKEEGKPIQGGTTYNMYDSGNGIAVDGAGNVYVGGSLVDTVFVNQSTMMVEGRQRGMIAKYNSAGVQQWLKRIGGGNEHAVVNGLAIDAAGNPYIIGNYKDTASISGTALPNAASRDIFIARLTPAGAVTWMKTASSGSTDFGAAIAIDANGSVAATGAYDSVAATFGTITATGPGVSNGFVARLSNTVVTGVAEAATQLDVSVFPNPASGALFVDCREKSGCDATIIDGAGRVMREVKLECGVQSLDVQRFAPGTYFITLRSAEGVVETRRFVKL